MFFAFLCSVLVILMFKMAPKHSAEVLAGIIMCNKAIVCLMEKICALDKPCSGMSRSAIGCEFNDIY